MQQLFPTPEADVDLEAAYRVSGAGGDDVRARAHLRLNMVASADGAITVEGRTERLGGPGDRRIFLLLRALADVILVGAETVRAEGYGPPRPTDEARAARRARGQAELPRIAVVTRSLALDWGSALFQHPGSRPLVLAPTDADPAHLDEAARVADVVRAGTGSVDLGRALAALAEGGVGSVLCEGGPVLNAALAEADLIDELCLTVAPSLVGAAGEVGLVDGARLGDPAALDLRLVLEEDGFLFLRYGVSGKRRSRSR